MEVKVYCVVACEIWSKLYYWSVWSKLAPFAAMLVLKFIIVSAYSTASRNFNVCELDSDESIS